MEAKQYVTKYPRDHWRTQEEIKKYLETNDKENTTIQIYGMQQKQF